ncbi:hypothetical protein CC78DRAFT_541262 [Lojkania enalia]|uniref:Uncharacterized protein n=1 Tax=Lojkania enalia TaxID=147567 RepID=A0A9P4KJA3_9PLEO|nr:hypothetical protein CC78DRAFT_541262 [Didymosphaeria enalia]
MARFWGFALWVGLAVGGGVGRASRELDVHHDHSDGDVLNTLGQGDIYSKQFDDSVGISPRDVFSPEDHMIVNVARMDSCEVICKPSFCVDDVVLHGTTTHLTYLCPQTESSSAVQNTVWVTVTELKTFTPTTTVFATDVNSAVHSNSGEPEDTTTIRSTITVFQTKTIHRLSSASSILPSLTPSSAPSTGQINSTTASYPTSAVYGGPSWSNIPVCIPELGWCSSSGALTSVSHTEVSSTEGPITSSFPAPTSSSTASHIETSPIKGSISSKFPVLTLSSTINGTIADGVSYTHYPKFPNSTYVPTDYIYLRQVGALTASNTDTHNLLSSHGIAPNPVTITFYITANRTMGSMAVASSGAQAIATSTMKKGHGSRNELSPVALWVCWMVAALVI